MLKIDFYLSSRISYLICSFPIERFNISIPASWHSSPPLEPTQSSIIIGLIPISNRSIAVAKTQASVSTPTSVTSSGKPSHKAIRD